MEPIKPEPFIGQLIMRPATKADLDSITQVVEAGFPDDPGCPYKYPYRAKYPSDFWKWTRVQYEEYLGQPEKYVSLVVTAPVLIDDGKRVVHKPISIAVWDTATEIKSTGSDLGINERRDANPQHMSAYSETMKYAFEKYFAKYEKKQIHLVWLITHPDFRRRGAATMLCNWGREEAIKRGWMWTVIASPMGKSVYEHLGCDLLGTETVRVPGEVENVVIYMMEEKFKHPAWLASLVLVSALVGLGALYCIFWR